MYETRDTHHRIAAKRRANGRPDLPKLHDLHKMGSGRYSQNSFNIEEFEKLDNATTAIMGFTAGFQYTPGPESNCANKIFDYLGAWVNGIDDAVKIYLPWYWPEIQVALQDIIYSGQTVIYDCDVNQLFTTLSHLVSTEGVAEIGARIAGAAPFQIADMIAVFQEEDVSTYRKAYKLGQVVSVVLNYTIDN